MVTCLDEVGKDQNLKMPPNIKHAEMVPILQKLIEFYNKEKYDTRHYIMIDAVITKLVEGYKLNDALFMITPSNTGSILRTMMIESTAAKNRSGSSRT
jgi:hypothetical protein